MNRRRLAFMVFLLGLIAILAVGFYLGATHQAPHPVDDESPAVSSSQG